MQTNLDQTSKPISNLARKIFDKNMRRYFSDLAKVKRNGSAK